MTSILFTLFEAFIFIIYITKYCDIDNKAILCILFPITYLFSYNLYNHLIIKQFIFIISTYLIIYLHNKKTTMNETIGIMIGISLIPICKLLFIIPFNTYISSHLTYSIFIVICYQVVLHILMTYIYYKIYKNKHLNSTRILYPILFLIFIILSLLEASISNNQITQNKLYIIMLLINIILVFIMLTFLTLNNINTSLKNQELANLNKRDIINLYDNINKLNHSMTYNLIHIKHFIKDGKLEEAMQFIDTCINKTTNYKNLIHTDNPFFDRLINQLIRDLSHMNNDIKVICNIKNISLTNDEVNDLILFIKQIFNSSDTNSPFTLSITSINNYIKVELILIQVDDLYINSNNFSYQQINDYVKYTRLY